MDLLQNAEQSQVDAVTFFDDAEVSQLSELQLALVGGGIADLINS